MIPGPGSPPALMGIVNVTPDSFSDGGLYNDTGAAVRHAIAMLGAGADIIDVGGESTRPGSARIDAAGQMERVIPVIESLRAAAPAAVISIDTTLSEVAVAALGAGAAIINDVTAGRDDPGMFRVAADAGVPLVLMHMQGEPATMQENPSYGDAVAEIRAFLLERAALAEQEGVAADRILIDPGIGFGKSREHNLQLIAALDRFVETGYAVLLGASRKRFMGSICNEERYADLVGATCATTVLGTLAGVRVLRVHDIRENRQARDVTWAIKGSNKP